MEDKILNKHRHSDRIYNDKYNEPISADIKETEFCEFVISEEVDETTGIICKKLTKRKFVPNTALKASDFALENIISIGAYDMLRDCNLQRSNLSTVDNINDTLSNLDINNK